VLRSSYMGLNIRGAARLAVPLLGAALLACSQSGSTTSSSPDAAKILREAGQAMTTVKTVAADVKFGGAAIQVQGLTLVSAASKLRLPADSDTTFKVKQGDFLVDLQVVTSGGRVFLKLPFGGFSELTGQEAQDVPDVSQLMNAESGLPGLLAAGKDPTYQGTEKVAGVETYKVATTYTADQIGKLLGGRLTPHSDVHATIWVGQADHLVRKAVLSGSFTSSGKSNVEVDLHDFNQPVTITSPPT
jgi:hypothetical protein